MTSSIELEKIEKLRLEYSALANKTYFNFGGQGIMANESIEAILAAYRQVQEEGPFSGKMFAWMNNEIDSTRKMLAEAFGGQARCYAITQNVTEAVNIVLWGLSWQPGDRLLITDCEHPGVVDTVNNIARRLQLEVVTVPVRGLFVQGANAESDSNSNAETWTNILSEAIGKDGKTRLFVFSHVLWNSGEALPLETISRVCREHGVLSLADGAQSAGVLPLDVSAKDAADFYTFTGHKWLCGPEGTGALYVAPERLSELEPTYMGWRHYMHGEERGAEKYEIATSSFPLLAGWRAAFAMHEKAGSKEERHKQILKTASTMRTALEKLGAELVPNNGQSGLVSFILPGKNHNQVVKELEGYKVMVRSIPEPDCLRASVHYLTSAKDVETLIDSLTKIIHDKNAT